MDEITESLEIKITYLEDQVSDLNDVVVSQYREIEELRNAVSMLERKIKDMEEGSEDRPSRKPPHY